ncbi:MAG TPA: DUF4124 domain-containing protein [Steroidobacteraceae bacterium]
MSVRAWLLALLVPLAGMGLADGQTNDKVPKTYRWVDEKGVVHYGDRIPAQDTQREHTVLNREGVEVGRSDAQKSPAQIAEEARREQEAMRLEQHDTFLLTTYTSAKDIEDLRDARLEELNSQHVAAEQYIENLNASLMTLQSLALTFKPYNTSAGARRMPDDVAANLVRAMSELHTQRNTLEAKDKEAQAVRTEFNGDIQRYKDLRAKMLSR